MSIIIIIIVVVVAVVCVKVVPVQLKALVSDKVIKSGGGGIKKAKKKMF